MSQIEYRSFVDPYTGDTFAVRECESDHDDCVVISKTIKGQEEESDTFHLPVYLAELLGRHLSEVTP